MDHPRSTVVADGAHGGSENDGPGSRADTRKLALEPPRKRDVVGIQAIVLNHVVIGEHCLVAAGAVIPERKTFPARSLIMGAPAKVARELNDDDVAMLRNASETYVKRRGFYLNELTRLG